jgi:heat shock protein HslJ
MSKVQIISYAAAVLIITVLVYLYTSEAQAPQATSSSNNSDSFIHTKTEIEANSNQPIESGVEEESATDEQDLLPKTDPVETIYNNSITDINWRWLRTENATGTIILEPKNSRPFILVLTASGTINSQTDCNTISGSFTQNNTLLSLGLLMSTKMYCEDSKEAEYSQNLSKVESFTIVDNTLRLFLSDNLGTMFFVRIKKSE